jgi:hypothetical protein
MYFITQYRGQRKGDNGSKGGKKKDNKKGCAQEV